MPISITYVQNKSIISASAIRYLEQTDLQFHGESLSFKLMFICFIIIIIISVLSVSFLIGQSDYFCAGFSTLNWKPF